MAQDTEQAENDGANFVESLHDIQGEYITLNDLYAKEKGYAEKLSDMMKALQFEVDATIQIKPEVMGQPCQAAYLISEAVVVTFDPDGNMVSKPLHRFPPNVIVSVIEDCTPELGRLISEKRRAESGKVKSLERVLKELKKAQATFKQTKRDELEADPQDLTEEEIEKPVVIRQQKEEAIEKPTAIRQPKEQVEVAPQARSRKEAFTFKGVYGEREETSEVPL